MAIIYKITNLISGKSYIGQTRMMLRQRMNKHYSQARLGNATGIDGAIAKYGKENFSVEIIEECEVEKLDERERYYIQKYNTYEDGYNLTLGGQDGAGSYKDFSVKEVQDALNKGGNIKKASEILGCCQVTLSNFMKRNNIENPWKNVGRVENILGKGCQFKEGNGAKTIYCQELDMTFNSLKECSQWLFDNNYSTAVSMDAIRKSLSRHLVGERKTYLKMHFKYV